MIGRHYDLERATARQDTAVLPVVGDAHWLLAAAMLENLSQDLALTHAAGWWQSCPREMAGKAAEADALLRELYSSPVQELFELITAATGGRVKLEIGWLLRQARGKSDLMRAHKARLGVVSVCERLRLTQRAGLGNRKYEGLPPSKLPDGRSNPAYAAARSAFLKSEGKCRDCRAPLVRTYGPRCAACREDNNRRMREWSAKKREVAA